MTDRLKASVKFIKTCIDCDTCDRDGEAYEGEEDSCYKCLDWFFNKGPNKDLNYKTQEPQDFYKAANILADFIRAN